MDAPEGGRAAAWGPALQSERGPRRHGRRGGGGGGAVGRRRRRPGARRWRRAGEGLGGGGGGAGAAAAADSGRSKQAAPPRPGRCPRPRRSPSPGRALPWSPAGPRPRRRAARLRAVTPLPGAGSARSSGPAAGLFARPRGARAAAALAWKSFPARAPQEPAVRILPPQSCPSRPHAPASQPGATGSVLARGSQGPVTRPRRRGLRSPSHLSPPWS